MKKRKTTNTVLIILGIFIFVFTVVCIWLFYLYQTVPDTLVTCVFGLCGTECGVIGWIRTMKTKYYNPDESEVINPMTGLDSDFEEVQL